ncbi:winged helix-turn-helix transcriptional regulator [Pedobacter frigoris]|uniref:Helix-turn-helix transcriptional regulator n=1 Tax=Pedobacter frigoris TaxID=2571272 RepID=A0A4U1CL42_9SPHI|nr:helix-turn-helix domain-containing protein [Pedobacter frigoris]TKC05850.1 helix-turn-helix transcriptional regulator [Pedobacter frigoris]
MSIFVKYFFCIHSRFWFVIITTIVYSISQRNNRFHLLKKELPNISEQVLGRQLKELETHAIIVKKEIPETVPIGIEYILTTKGLDLVPILESLSDWGKTHADGKEISVCSLS